MWRDGYRVVITGKDWQLSRGYFFSHYLRLLQHFGALAKS